MAETIIGSNITIEGDISGSDPLTVHGTIKGTLQVDDVVTIATSGSLPLSATPGATPVCT